MSADPQRAAHLVHPLIVKTHEELMRMRRVLRGTRGLGSAPVVDRFWNDISANQTSRRTGAAARSADVRLADPDRASSSLQDPSGPGACTATDLRRQFDAAAASWDAEHGPASARALEFAARTRYLRARCRDLDRPRVLDLGCGTGQTLVHLADLIPSGIGVDISAAMISRAQQNARMRHLRFHIGDAVDFCLKCRERFALVLLIGVLGHLPDQAAMLAAAHRVLMPRGRLIIISAHPWNPLIRIKRLIDGGCDAPPSHHPSPLRLKTQAEHNGFELLAIRALPYLPWPGLNGLLAGRSIPSTGTTRCHAFAGVLRGAFAAELGRCASLNRG